MSLRSVQAQPQRSTEAKQTGAQASRSPGNDGRAPADTLKIDAKLVVVPVVVRDRKGAIVKDLAGPDFAIAADDKPQTIRYFDREDDVPFTVGLLVDTSQSQRDALDDEREASRAFVDTLLASAARSGALQSAAGSTAGSAGTDKAFVIQFAHDIEMLQDVTDQRAALAKALRELGTAGPEFHNTDPGDTRDDEGRRVQHGGTALYDALFLANDEVLSKQKGRRALVVLSDGVDNGSKETLEDAIEAAQRANVVVYAIYFKGEERRKGGFGNPGNGGGRRGSGGGWPGGGGGGWPGGGGGYPGGGSTPGSGNGGGRDPGNTPTRRPNIDGKRVLARVCGETGGRLFELSKKQTAADAYRDIAEELRSQYRLGFTPDEAASRDRYHRLEVTLQGSAASRKLEVQTREGYYISR